MEWIKITLCAIFFYSFCFMCPLLAPKVKAVYVHMRALGKMHFSVGFLYPCDMKQGWIYFLKISQPSGNLV